MKRTAVAVALWLLTFSLQADVRGTVVDPDGVPLADALVELFTATSPEQDVAALAEGRELKPESSTRTDSKGNFRIPAKSGNFMLRWSAPGFAPGAIDTNGDEDLGGLLLRRAAAKQGRVTAGGKAVANAIVVLSRGARMIVRTDEQGRYTVADPRAWFPALTVIHPDYALARLDGFRQTPVPLDVQLVSGKTVTGRVLAPDGKTGVRAKLYIDGIAAGESADDGTYELRHVPGQWTELAAISGELAARVPRSAPRVLHLARAFAFRGNVADPATGTPIAGAIVKVAGLAWDSMPIGIAATDARGAFTIPALLPGRYRVSATRAGYGSANLEIPVDAETRKTIGLTRIGRVSGTIGDEQRRPVGGAFVRSSPRGRNVFSTVQPGPQVSAPDGRYALRTDPSVPSFTDELEIVAQKNGFAKEVDAPHRVGPGETKTVNLTLSRGVALEGRVANADGQPLRGVAVAAIELPPNVRAFSPAPRNWADLPTTGADGKFTVRVRPGSYTVHFQLPGFAPKRLAAVAVAAESQPLEVVLEPAASISGRVVTANGQPVADAAIGTMTEGATAEATTDSTGSFRLDGLPHGNISISVTPKGSMNFVDREIKAPAEGVTIELLPTVRVSGRVQAKGGGSIRDFQVDVTQAQQGDAYWSGPQNPTDVHDADGRFVLEDVVVRPSELVVRAPGHAPARVALQLEKGRDVEDLEVTVERAATIEGRVTDEAGAPLDRVRVEHHAGGEARQVDAVTTDANGDYVVDGVPAGQTTLSFARRGYQTLKKQVELTAGDTRLDVRLATGRVLTGRVVDGQGSPVPEASVEAYSQIGGGAFSTATTDSAGKFRLEGLGPFIYQVQTSRRGLLSSEPETVDVAKTSDITIRLESGATVTGRVLGLDRSRFREILVNAAGSGRNAHTPVDAAGRFRLEGAPTGKIGVRAIARGESSRTSELVEIETANGGTYEVDIEFREHNTIRGRVTRRGEPVRSGAISFSPQSGLRGGGSGSISATGEYEVSGVRTGENYVVIYDWDNASMNYVTTRTISRSETVDIDMNPAVVRGRVVDETTGEPVADADVVLERPNSEYAWSRPKARSGSDGRILLESVSPGTYDLRVSREGYASHLASQSISEGATVDLEVALKRSAGLVLHLIDARNGQRIGAAIATRTTTGAIAYNGTPRPRADGSILLPLAPGRYRIIVQSQGLGVVEIAADSPGSREVTLRPGGTVEIATSCSTCRARMIAADGSPYYTDTFSTTPDFRVMNGTRVTDAAAGTYTLQLLDETGTVTKSVPVVVREGEITKVDL